MLGFLSTLFKPAPLLEPAQADWQHECLAWFLRNCGGYPRLRHAVLVLPTSRFFAKKRLSGHALVEDIFGRVKSYAGMENWPCTLQAQEADPETHVAPTIIIRGAPTSPLGTFRVEHGHAFITYNPKSVNDPAGLIATFAHELGHYLMSTIHEPPPGKPEYREFATDMISVFLGFGIFSACSSFNFSQFQDVSTQGWSVRRQGYLSQPEFVYALALFGTLLEKPAREITPYLSSFLAGCYKQAARQILEKPERLNALRRIGHEPWETHQMPPRHFATRQDAVADIGAGNR